MSARPVSHRLARWLLVGAVALFSVPLLPTAVARAQEPLDAPSALNDGWEVDAPAEVGLDSRRLDELTDTLRAGAFGNVHALLIERAGKLVYEEYFEGEDRSWGSELGHVRFGRASLHDLRSITKSVVSTLVGIAIDRGLITSVEAPLRELLPDYAHLLTGDKASIRLEDALTMSAGLEWDEWSVPYTDPDNDERRLYEAEDPIAFVLERPLVDPPGSRFVYSGGVTQLLAAVVEEASGQELEEFAREELFRPLGIYDVVWRGEPDESGMPAAASGLRLRPRDLAKLGSVFLNGGRWGEERVVSEAWVREATRPHLPVTLAYLPDYATDVGYGYQWWTASWRTSHGELFSPSAVGNGDQRIILVPELGLSVTMLAGLYDSPDPEVGWMPDRLVVEYIVPSVRHPSGN